VENDHLTWPKRFLDYKKTVVVSQISDITARVL